jgi:hypothetical protein
MIEQQHHEMIWDKTHPSGTDEWYCPTCGRRIQLTSDSLTIIESGDRYASHSGSKGGLHIGLSQPAKQKADEALDKYLRLWIKAIDELDFNW